MPGYLPVGGNFPTGYQAVYDPFDPNDQFAQGGAALGAGMNNLQTGAAFANSLSSENMRAMYPAQAQVQLGQLQYQTEVARQNAINQRIGPLLQLLAGAFGHLSGGQSGFSGFQSNFGQGAGAAAGGAPAPAAAPSPMMKGH